MTLNGAETAAGQRRDLQPKLYRQQHSPVMSNPSFAPYFTENKNFISLYQNVALTHLMPCGRGSKEQTKWTGAILKPWACAAPAGPPWTAIRRRTGSNSLVRTAVREARRMPGASGRNIISLTDS